MRMQNYDEKLSFALTGDLDVIRGTNDDGVPTFAIGTGKSVDNEGTESLTWQVNVSSGNRGENLEEQASGITLNGGDLKVTVRFLATSRNFLGMELTINTCLIFLFHPEKLYILNSVCVGNADRQTQWLEAIDQVLAAIRLDGKSGNFRKLTLQDLDASANENLAFPGATPGENQHSHLDFLERSRGALSMFGGMVQMNQSGTEYSFQSLDAYDEDEDTAKANIIAADKGGFALADTALKMGELFRVDASVFNANEDREQEIQNGLVRRCAMYEAFRSFAWTLAAYCDKESLTPEAVPAETLEDIASFVVDDRNRLNYVGDSFCPTICSGDDIHNYYIPDGTPAAAREELIASMGDEEDKDPAARILSLEGLRKDLTYLYPAMQTIYDSLAARRDFMEALEGNLPEVLYVWCAMTYAAREPIYTEDGPMTCWWSHPGAPAKLLPPQKNVQPAEKKAPDAGYHFTYDKGLTYEDSKFIFNYPDNFVFSKNPGDREFILYLPNPEEPDNHEAADFAIYAGKEMDAPANSQMKLPVVYGAVYSAFTAAIPGSEAWYYSRRDLPGVIAAGIDSDCVHANAVVPFGDKVKMIRFQISIKNRRQGEACQALICSILDHFSVKDPVELLTEPDDGKFVNMTLTDSEVREWTELLDAHREQMVFARNHQQENMVGKYQQNNPGMPTIRKELRQMLRYHNGHGATYLKKADALYQLMRLRYPDAPALKTMKKAMDEAFLELVDQFVNLGEEKVTATDDYLEIYKSHGRKAATTAIKEILEICRDLLTPEMVAALEAASGKPAAKVNTTVSIPVEAPVIDTEEQKRREAAAAAEKKRKEEEALAEKLRAVAAEKRAIEAAEAALEDMLQDVQRQRRDAERSFDRDQREIQRMASTSINIYDYNMESTVRRIVSTADRAGKSLNGTCQRLVTKLDAKCDAVYVPGVSGVLMKKIAAEFHELNETSIVEIDFTGSFEGTSFGHVGDINYQPSRESLRMEARWEQVAKEAKGLDESALLSKHGISRDAWVKHQAYEKAVTEQEKAKTSAAMRKALSALEALGDYRDAADRAADCEKKIPVLEEKEAREEQERKAREEERKRKEAEALQRYLDAHAAWEQEKKTALANREAYIEEGLKACERDLRKKLDDWYRRETEALDEKERRAKAQKEEQENLLATLGFFQFGAKSACKQQIQAAEATLAGIPGARQRLENENRQKREGIKTDVEKKKSALTAEAERKFPISQEPKRP